MQDNFFTSDAKTPYVTQKSRAAKRGCFKRGGFPIWTCPSFFVLFCPFWDFPDFSGIFPICAGMVRGFSRFVLFLFLSLLRAPTRNSPERVRDTIWTFPEKSGKHPGLETPRFSFSQKNRMSLNHSVPESSSENLAIPKIHMFFLTSSDAKCLRLDSRCGLACDATAMPNR